MSQAAARRVVTSRAIAGAGAAVRFVYMSDVLPTAWQAVDYCDLGDGPGSVAVIGLGPIGEMAARIAQHRGYRVFGIDPVAERTERSAAHGVEIVGGDNVVEQLRELTDGRGPDAVIDAVGMEAHGSGAGKIAHDLIGLMPDTIAEKMMNRAGVDRLGALHLSIELVRRGGTVSLSGVYGGEADPMPMLTMFDKQIKLRMGQANVKRWIPDIMPLLTGDGDPLGVDDFATHKLPLDEAPNAYEMFQKKEDGAFKVVFQP